MKPNTVAKIVLLSFSSLFLVGSFQNCAKASHADGFQSPGSGASASISVGNNNPGESFEKVDSVDLSTADYIVVSLRSLFAEETQRRTVKDFQNLQVNLKNGEMKSVDTDGTLLSPVRLCLKQQELEEFKMILRSAKLCQPLTAAAREDVVCAQVFKYPFALLQYGNGEQIKLGEVNGCHRSPDLCEEYRDVYNAFISYIRNNLENRKCL